DQPCVAVDGVHYLTGRQRPGWSKLLEKHRPAIRVAEVQEVRRIASEAAEEPVHECVLVVHRQERVRTTLLSERASSSTTGVRRTERPRAVRRVQCDLVTETIDPMQ